MGSQKQLNVPLQEDLLRRIRERKFDEDQARRREALREAQREHARQPEQAQVRRQQLQQQAHPVAGAHGDDAGRKHSQTTGACGGARAVGAPAATEVDSTAAQRESAEEAERRHLLLSLAERERVRCDNLE